MTQRSGEQYTDREWARLRRLYLDENLPAWDVAQRMGRSQASIEHHAHVAGYRKRPPYRLDGTPTEFSEPEPERLAERPCPYRPGSPGKVAAMAERLAAGVELWHPQDGEAAAGKQPQETTTMRGDMYACEMAIKLTIVVHQRTDGDGSDAAWTARQRVETLLADAVDSSADMTMDDLSLDIECDGTSLMG